jgi:hypothetical protein
MSALNFDSGKVKLLTLCRDKMAEWFKIYKEADWELQVDSAKEKVAVHCYTSPRDKNTFKASGVVDYPTWLCFTVMTAANQRQKYDINIAESRMI